MPEAPVHHVHPLGVGDVVPDFTLPDHNGTQRTLSEAVAERPVLLVFYPFAFSGICTGELSEIRDDLGAFDNDGDSNAAGSKVTTRPLQADNSEHKGKKRKLFGR